ncbi:transmembrane protein 213-like [Acipenser ruthenus]|uniref:transmembrane protein 213-like n=1 Tax=Acipenser ruthenus TaxID=7906 RepID=UPI00145B959C|nr:transmembrane protein 213-like [Acipenser ruthenus]
MRNIATAVTFTLVSFTVICHVTGSESTISNSTNHGSSISSDECSDVTATCSMAAKCCQMRVGDYGWIAAAVGWGLWFLTLILLCANKLSKMGVDEQKKYIRA